MKFHRLKCRSCKETFRVSDKIPNYICPICKAKAWQEEQKRKEQARRQSISMIDLWWVDA